MSDQDLNSHKYFTQRRGSLKLERSSFDGHYKELQEFVKPRRGRFFTQDRNDGTKKHQSIINDVATQAHQIARAGMYAGIMSPARPWFALATFDPGLMESQNVKIWLNIVENLLLQIFNAGNL